MRGGWYVTSGHIDSVVNNSWTRYKQTLLELFGTRPSTLLTLGYGPEDTHLIETLLSRTRTTGDIVLPRPVYHRYRGKTRLETRFDLYSVPGWVFRKVRKSRKRVTTREGPHVPNPSTNLSGIIGRLGRAHKEPDTHSSQKRGTGVDIRWTMIDYQFTGNGCVTRGVFHFERVLTKGSWGWQLPSPL